MKQYVLFESFDTFNAQQPIGVFTEEDLLHRLYSGEMDTTSVVTLKGSRGSVTAINDLPFIREILQPKPDNSFDTAMSKLGYVVPNIRTESRIRNADDGVYRNTWKKVRVATHGVNLSSIEMEAFLDGESLETILSKRFEQWGTVSSPYSAPATQPITVRKYRKPEESWLVTELSNTSPFVMIVGAMMAVVFIGGICYATLSGPNTSSAPARPLSREDQLIRDAVTLQRMIDHSEKERQDKFNAEYRRQERGYE